VSLDIYYQISAGVYIPFLEDDSEDDLLPIITTHDGILGEVVERKLYVRNDDPDEWYSNITIVPISNVSPNEVDGISTGHGVKLFEGDIQPTEAEWEATDYANTLSLSELGEAGSGDTSTYLPFWYRVEVPAGTPISNRETSVLRLSFTANIV
jgi:hypothetical protein